MHFAQIILPLNLKGTLTYKIPDDLVEKIQLGMRVLVPFRGKKIYTGIVAELHDQQPKVFLPKEIISILDDIPILPESQLNFWKWFSNYYLCNMGEIYRFVFPSSLKLESKTYLKLKPNVKIDYEALGVHEQHLIQALEVRSLVNITDIEAFIPKKNLIRTINTLIDLQMIEVDERIAEKYKVKEIAYLKIEQEFLKNESLTSVLHLLNKAPKQKELFLYILSKQSEHPEKPIRKSEILAEGNFAYQQLKSLLDRGLITEYFLKKDRIEQYEGETENIEPLTDLQKEVSDKISAAFALNKNVLLHGVTSSGKTHIYLEKVEQVIAEGKSALILLPEIALTKQFIQRLEKKYSKKIGFYHQKLTDFERVEIWKKIRNNEIDVIIGTRNALFLPFKDVGLIVIDEEHDSAYKRREVFPYFNAKDAALMLAHFYGSKVILGSATPSVESYFAAKNGKLKYIFLGKRFGNVNLPKYQLINFKEAQISQKVLGNFSNELLQVISENLEKKNQIMILHNRRGYANVVECESCGYATYCSNCDVVMTYHKSANEMKCHYCGQRAAKPQFCPKCHSHNLSERGVGVEQIHEELQKLLPDAEIDRMDVDSMRKKFAYEKLYEKIEERLTDIIVGTQMISKGLNFDHIELVCIPRADQMLHVQDFRAEERAFQLITQIAGRAGRVSGEGKVYIQTFHPQHYVFQLIKEEDISNIYKYFLKERKKFHYPPFTKIIMIELKHRREDKVERASRFLGSVLRKYFPEEFVFGPEKSPIARINAMYQFQIMLKLPRGKKYKVYKSLAQKSFEEFDEITAYQSIKRAIFVDF